MSFLSWIQQNVNAIQSAATTSPSEVAKSVQRRLTMANRASASLSEATGSSSNYYIRPRTRSKSDGSPSPPVLLPVNRQRNRGLNHSSPTRRGGQRVKPTLQHAATADLINRVQEADGGFFESFSALSWKRENRRLQAVREEEAKKECRPPTMASIGVQTPLYQITKKEWQRLYVTVLYTISNQIGSRASERTPYNDDLYRFAQMSFGVSDDDHKRLITMALNEQPPIIVLNVTVVEAQGLEAKDPNGFSDPFCMLGIQPSAANFQAAVFDNSEPEDEDENRLKKHHSSFKLSFKRKEAAKKQETPSSPSQSQSKSGNSSGDGFSNDIPAKYICATSVKPHTLNPHWDEKFTFDIDDVSTDRLHLDIWDNDDESSVLEAVRQLNQVQSWKGLGRYFKQIAQSARSHGSYSVDDFLGCVDVNLNDIPSKGLEGWFPLQGRSQRSSVQGELRLRLALTTRDRVAAEWEIREHEKMLSTFIQYETIKQGEEVYRWRGKLSVEAEVILHQHAVQNDLAELQQAISRWRAFSQKHREQSFDYSALYRLLQKLNQAWSHYTLTSEEEQSLADSFSEFVEFSLSLLTKHKQVFPPINKAAIYKLEFLLKCLRLISDMQAFWRCCPFHKEIHLEIINCIKKGNVEWYDKLYSQSRSQNKNEDRGLIDLVNLINADLQRCVKYYNKLFDSIINVNYFLIIYKQLDKLLMEQLKKDWKWKVEEDVKGVVERLCRQLRDNNDISDDPSADNLNMGTAMFELYLSLQEFANFKDHLQPSDRRGLCCVGFHEWFSGALLKWLTIARFKAMLRIRKAVELDRATQVDSNVRLSTSAVDTTACFYQIKDFWKQLAWSDMVTAYPFVFKILDDICNGAIFYGQLIHQKLQEVGYFDDDGQFDVTEQLCLTINNMEHVKQNLKSIPDELGIFNILNAIDKAEGDVYGHQCRHTLNTMLSSADEDVENKIIIVVQKVGDKMKADLKKSIFHLAWAPDALPADNAIVPLLEYLDNNLATLNQTLFRSNFLRMLEVLWILVLEELKCQAESGIGEKQTIYFQRLHDACNILLEFFHAEQKGLDIQKLHCQTYQQVDDVLQLHKSETNELISKYFLGKIEEQKSLTKRDFGSLTVKVYFHHDCLFIEILHGRDIIALDPNGLSDPFVIIELDPPWLFPSSSQQRTKVQKKTLNPLFDECFEYAVTLEQCKSEGALVMLTVMDHDLMLSNDFAGEACLPLNSIAGVNSFLPASEIHRLPSTELILTRPKFTDSEILVTLDKRSWDKTAQDFVKKRKSQLL